MQHSLSINNFTASTSKVNRGKIFRFLLLCGLITTLLFSTLYLSENQYAEDINQKTLDLILRSRRGEFTDLSIVIVDIDEKSLLRYGQWPWPRYRLAELLRFVNAAGGSKIGIDILFPEVDRSSPKNWRNTLRRDLGQDADISKIPEELQDYDQLMATVLANGPFVLGYGFLFEGENTEGSGCHLSPMRTDRTVRDQPEVFAPYQAEGVVCSNELLSSAAKSSGFLNGLTDRDGLVRRFPLVIRHGDQLFPSFSLAMIATGQTWPADQVMRVEENQFAVRYLHLGKRKFPVDEQANFLVSQGDPTAILHVSAEELMLGKIDPKLFRNAVILIGSTAAGIGKIYSTPFVSAISELDLHAFFIQSLLTKKPPVRSDYFLFCEIGVTLVMLIAITCCAMLVSTLLNCACCLTGLVLIWFGATVCFQMTGYLFSPLLPSIVVVFNCSLMTSVRFYFYQKQAKEETGDVLLMLKSSETTLHSILKAVPDVVYRLDKQGKFTFLSAAIYRYTKNPEALLGQSVTHILVPDDQPEVNFRLMERRTGTRVTNGLEVRICLPESDDNHGEEIYFLIRSEGLYRDDINCPDCFLGTQGIARDITVQKKLEHQLMHAQKMEMVGNLAAGIAHDLNNVLSGLVTYPEMLMNTLDKESKMYRDMSVILKAGQMAAAIVGDLLTLARRGGNTILEPCDLNTIVDEYLSSAECLRVLHLHPQCAFKKSLAKDLKSVQGSPVHLTKVIMNIVHNAVEAMPTGGTVQISTSNCWLTEDYQGYELVQKGEYVRLEVTDPGIGIGPNEIEHVFEPFYSRKKMDKSGTGLGMTILWLTVKDHFGYIDLQSAVGNGTTVRVFLPVCSLRQENGDGGAAVKIAN